MKSKYIDGIVVLVILLFSLAIWMPSRYYPYFWDSTYIVKTAIGIIDSNFTNLTSIEQGYAHATLLPTLLALIWKFFGTSTLYGHYLMAIFLPILLISSYFFFKSKTNIHLAILGTFLIGFTPVILAEYVNFYSDLPMAAFVAISLLFWEKRLYFPWAIFYAAAILTKVPAIAVLPYFVLDSLSAKDFHKLKLALSIPLSVFIGWFTYHKIITGWWFLNNHGRQLAAQRNLTSIPSDWLNIVIAIFLQQGRLYLALIVLAVLVYLSIGKTKLPLRQVFILIYKELAVIITAGLIFAMTGEFGPRYAIFTYIFVYSIILKVIYQTSIKHSFIYRALLATLLASLLFFTSLWRPKVAPLTTNVFAPPDDLGIIDYISLFRWLGSYVALNNNQNIEYYGAFPENVALSEPKMGFVTQPTFIKSCQQFTYNPSIKQIIIFHPFSPDLYPCFQLIKTNNFPAITGKEENGRWIDLYLVTASAAATPNP